MPRRRRHDHGFAIILVLWLLVVLAAIGTQLIAGGRSELQIAYNLDAAARAEALADGGIARAVFALGEPSPEQRWNPDGQPHRLTVGEHRMVIVVRDENTKINPNLASSSLMIALLREVGVEQAVAETVAAAIEARVRPPAASGAQAASGTPPASGTPTAKRPGVRFDSIDELADLPGMTAATVAALRPHLSIYASAAVPTLGNDPVVARAVEQARAETGTQAKTNPQARPEDMTVSITSEARRAGGAAFSRDAVVRVDPADSQGYRVLRWGREDTDDN